MFSVTKMKAMRSEDLEFLQGIRGRFPNSKSQRQGEWLLIFLLGVFFPLFWLAVLFAWWPVVLDRDHLAVAAFALGTFVVGIYIWSDRAVEYEFTGDEIIERRAGRIKNQIRIADIVETKVKISPHQLIIKTSSSKMTVQIVPSLNEVIQKKATEMMATKSETERQNFEKVKLETSSRLKRANIIGAVVLMLFAFALLFLLGWLKQRNK
jgi:hypothetical protein